MLPILYNNLCLFCLRSLTPDLGFCITFYTSSVEFPRPNKIDHFAYMTERERPDDWVYLYDNSK